ncbi:MAG: Omp28-related outer membrane protein [Bacteroidota bacterium]
MKNFLFSFILLSVVGGLSANAQLLVDTTQVFKNVIIEEFSGVECAGSPSGDSILAGILNAHPGRAFAVQVHRQNSSYTDPVCPGDPDFTRVIPDGFSPTVPGVIPAAALNREKFGYTSFFFLPSAWHQFVDTLLGQPSKLNVGFSSDYNSTTQELTIDIQVYIKEDLTSDPLLIVAALTEDNLAACQIKGAGYDTIQGYLHNHVLRELPTTIDDMNYWHESIITGPRTPGTLYSTQIIWNDQRLFAQGNLTDYNMANCNLVVYVRSFYQKFVYNGLGLKVGESSASISEISNTTDFNIYPNPCNGVFNFTMGNTKNASIVVYNILGEMIHHSLISMPDNYCVDISDKPKGIYIYHVVSENQIISSGKIIIE